MKPDADSHVCITATVDGRERRWRGRLGDLITHNNVRMVELFRRNVTLLIPFKAVKEIRRIEP